MLIFKRAKDARRNLFVFAVAGVLSASGMTGVTWATGTAPGNPVSGMSVAELSALNVNNADVVAMFGPNLEVDTSRAGNYDLSKGKTAAAKYLYNLDKGMKGQLITVVSPSFTFTAADSSYLAVIASKAYPTNGNGQMAASTISKLLAGDIKSSAAFSGNVGKSLKISGVAPLGNSSFPKGTYANVVTGTITFMGQSFPTKILDIVSGEGGSLTVYVLAFVSLSNNAAASNGLVKVFKEFQNLAIRKNLGGPVTTI